MKIKLLSNILHDGELLRAGMVCHDVPEEDALLLIASGVAVAVEESLDMPPAPLPFDPDQDMGGLMPADPSPAPGPDASPSVVPSPLVEPEAKIETGKKAVKA